MDGRGDEPTERDMATLVALADGSLDEHLRDAAERLVADSAELALQLAAQRYAVAALRSLDLPAPAHLRARIEPSRPRTSSRPSRRMGFAATGLTGALAAAALVAWLLPLGAPAPTVLETAALAQQRPTAPAPRQARREPSLLAAANAGVAYPNYRTAFGWRASGTRTDELGDRRARTVYYVRRGRRIAYTIVSGSPLEPVPGARLVRRGPAIVRLMAHRGRQIAWWLREGHTCVLSGAGTTARELIQLASWPGKGAIRF